MDPTAQPVSFYGHPTDKPLLTWEWVATRLVEAGTYWVVASSAGMPHPRPVWGVWDAAVEPGRLLLSIGSPAITRALAREPRVAVHLESGTEVVIVEGLADGDCVDADAITQYDAKYDWNYSLADYGPLTAIKPTNVLAWHSAGWAGRDGFQASASFDFR